MASPIITGMLIQQRQSEIAARAASTHRFERPEKAVARRIRTRRLRKALFGRLAVTRS